jgi:hypothetical protein
MRRRLLILFFAALAAITMAVPLWAALTSEHRILSRTTVNSSLRVNRSQLFSPAVAEAGTLVLTGGILLVLASAVRRTS